MMARSITGIDHVLVAVRDLDAARQRFGRLGFNTTPRGRHVGWGTGNYCIMFQRDYVELLGLVGDAQGGSALEEQIRARGEGLLGIAVGSSNPQATFAAWRNAGLSAQEPKPLGRLLEADGEVELRFTNVQLDLEASAGVPLFACHHETPELLRRSQWLAHPNGAVGLASVTIVTPDTRPITEAMTRIFGSSAITDTDHIVAVQTGNGVILIAPPEDAELIHAGHEMPEDLSEPEIRVLAVRVTDPAVTVRFLETQSVPYRRRTDGAILVDAAQACGVALEFVKA